MWVKRCNPLNHPHGVYFISAHEAPVVAALAHVPAKVPAPRSKTLQMAIKSFPEAISHLFWMHHMACSFRKSLLTARLTPSLLESAPHSGLSRRSGPRGAMTTATVHVDVAPQAASEVLHHPVERGRRADDEAVHAEAEEEPAA